MHLAPRALADLEAAYAHISIDAPLDAERWVTGMFDAIASLTTFPRRGARAPEEEYVRAGVRQLVSGNYRILFTVEDDRRLVIVVHIRHAARRALGESDLGRDSDCR